MEYQYVPKETLELLDQGAFWMVYTHTTADTNREGIEKTGKILSTGMALGEDIVPFSGEMLWYTHQFTRHTVSLSDHYMKRHHWASYTPRAWTPEISEKRLQSLYQQYHSARTRKKSLTDFENPRFKQNQLTQIEELIRLERLRQEKFQALIPEEQNALANPRTDIYTWDHAITPQTYPASTGYHSEHPYVLAEISLTPHLKGMFTDRDIEETKKWIENITGRTIPVGSLSALRTWEDTHWKLQSRLGRGNLYQQRENITTNPDFQQQFAREAKQYWDHQ